MAVRSSIGSTILPDVGTCSYNGITFSALYNSTISGRAVQDNAGRTVKWVELTITIEGVVTLNDGDLTTDGSWTTLRQLLSQDAGLLVYKDKGYGPLVVNIPGGGGIRDLQWGPKPQILEFVPLGGSRAARIRWTVLVTISEQNAQSVIYGGPVQLPVVQFTSEISIGYDEDYYSNLTIKGTLEIPLTRLTVNARFPERTVDDFRQRFMGQISAGIDLTRFRVARRNFNISRDRRTMEWEFVIEELPPMGLPPGATNARGHFSVRPMRLAIGNVHWICSLRCTYTMRKDLGRDNAWRAFLALWNYRMNIASKDAYIPNLISKKPPVPAANILASPIERAAELNAIAAAGPGGAIIRANIQGILNKVYDVVFREQKVNTVVDKRRAAFPLGMSIDEGLYMDSRTTSFEGTWLLITTMDRLLVGTGIWRQDGIEGEKIWKASVQDISGWKSWLQNSLVANQDAIVDMGGGS